MKIPIIADSVVRMTQASQLLNNKRVFITGGSRGIGAAIAKKCAEHGAEVGFTYSSRKDAADVVLEELKSYSKLSHFHLQMDVSQEESIQNALAQVSEKWNSIDVVINNAGVTKDQLFIRMKNSDFDAVLDTNLKGAFIICRHFAKLMMKAQSGNIINISSVIGHTGNPGQANYAASKAGLEAMTKSIALELASRNIRANCIAPGYIGTEMTGVLSDEIKQKILAKIPLNSIGTGEDIANAALFLASDLSKYMTAQTLHVNGGMYY